ncbi:MAG: RHS repeat-associated core domain-containing protein, partial [Planctomycetota bacterium]
MKIQYNRNRYYDYYTGRWTTHDPLGINPTGGKVNAFEIYNQYRGGTNIYQYASGNPAMFLDPMGLE